MWTFILGSALAAFSGVLAAPIVSVEFMMGREVLIMAFIIVIVLLIKAKPILAIQPLVHLLFSSSWYPLKGQFGFLPFIVGTLEVTAIAMVLSIPVCLG
jgi:phosphate transport system permease protein